MWSAADKGDIQQKDDLGNIRKRVTRRILTEADRFCTKGEGWSLVREGSTDMGDGKKERKRSLPSLLHREFDSIATAPNPNQSVGPTPSIVIHAVNS